MTKLFMLFLLLTSLWADSIFPTQTKQLLIVSADNFNTSVATLQAYEHQHEQWVPVSQSVAVNLGRTGLAWGLGVYDFKPKKNEPRKFEGDGKSPAGLFDLSLAFGYEKQDFHFPYRHMAQDDLCIDDVNSSEYNTLIHTKNTKDYKSFEWMRRDDKLYRLGIVVAHNTNNTPMRGSCIFIHVQKHKRAPTAGCTSMQEEKLRQIIAWLDPNKRPLLLQLPKQYLNKVLSLNGVKLTPEP
jgi:L,D-peptidoglycan transpeptidase YkuD (ErfK/YbiS/YcfS/YnhG family)